MGIDLAYLRGVEPERVSPEPELVELGADRLTYVFRAPNPDDPLTISFSIRPDAVGSPRWRMGIADGSVVRLHQFVYP